jgi:DNA polymerase-3 subunit delta
VLAGEDDYSLRLTLEDIKKGVGDHNLLPANISVLEGQHLSLAELRNTCETMPFLLDKRLVIVEGLLSRFEPRAKSGARKKAGQAPGQEDELKSLIGYLGKVPPSTVLVLVDGRVSSNNPLLDALLGKGDTKLFPLLKDTKLRQWVQKQVNVEGSSISAEAVDLLANLVGSNLWTMASEIKKLVLYASGRRIEGEDVRVVVSYAREASVFAMVDAILELKPAVAQRLLEQLLREGAAPAYLLFMLSRQAQSIVMARELRKQGLSDAEIQSRLGLSSGFALRRTVEQADRHSFARVVRLYHKLLETDVAIKTGRYDGGLALNILIAELGQ